MLAHGRWFSPGTPASSTTKTGRHDIAEILLKVALSTINQSINQSPACIYTWSSQGLFQPFTYMYKLLLSFNNYLPVIVQLCDLLQFCYIISNRNIVLTKTRIPHVQIYVIKRIVAEYSKHEPTGQWLSHGFVKINSMLCDILHNFFLCY